MGRDTDNFIRTENGPRGRTGLTLRQMNTVGNRTGLEVRITTTLAPNGSAICITDSTKDNRSVSSKSFADHHPTAVAGERAFQRGFERDSRHGAVGNEEERWIGAISRADNTSFGTGCFRMAFAWDSPRDAPTARLQSHVASH